MIEGSEHKNNRFVPSTKLFIPKKILRNFFLMQFGTPATLHEKIMDETPSVLTPGVAAYPSF